MRLEKVTFTNKFGHHLSATIDWPTDQKPIAYALFAHCFTCSKDLHASRSISRGLGQNGIAVFRFDFTGLGKSEGAFEDSSFATNLSDLKAACDYMEKHLESPQLLVGHSLGGAAVLRAGAKLDSVKAIATVGAPSDPEHVTHLLAEKEEEILEKGEATVSIGGRPFKVRSSFIEDLKNRSLSSITKELRGKALLILHSPQDTIVGINNAKDIYNEAHHPKSFISLDGADHLLSSKADGEYVGAIIGQWLSRYISLPTKSNSSQEHQVIAELANQGFTTELQSGRHHFLADEPETVGGENLGPSPYDLLSSALAACTAMTIQMYARRKEWPLEHVTVKIDHNKSYASDCESCEQTSPKIDRFERKITFIGELDESQIEKLSQIADKCPVHKTLHSPVEVHTKVNHLISQ